jgi:hypothetical protein
MLRNIYKKKGTISTRRHLVEKIKNVIVLNNDVKLQLLAFHLVRED